MLGVRKYPKDYVDRCLAKVEADIVASRTMAGSEDGAGAAVCEFEQVFFNNMVLVLDHLFVHRLRTVEGKHGNPLSEVRVLADSLTDNGGAMTVEGAIKLSPELSLLGIREGEQIRLSEADFVRLAEAFFAEIRRKFV